MVAIQVRGSVRNPWAAYMHDDGGQSKEVSPPKRQWPMLCVNRCIEGMRKNSS